MIDRIARIQSRWHAVDPEQDPSRRKRKAREQDEEPAELEVAESFENSPEEGVEIKVGVRLDLRV
jgi:hypothetical protein